MQHILEAVLDDDDRALLVLRKLVDELDRGLPHAGIERRERLVKDEYVHIIAEHARDRHLLFLTAGEVERHRAYEILHAHDARVPAHDRHHLAPGDALVFHGVGDVLAHGKAHELRVAVLEHRPHHFAQAMYGKAACFLSVHGHGAGDRPLVRKRDEPVDAVGKRRFPAAGAAEYEHLLAFMDLEVEVVQRRFLLHLITVPEVFESDDGLFHIT